LLVAGRLEKAKPVRRFLQSDADDLALRNVETDVLEDRFLIWAIPELDGWFSRTIAFVVMSSSILYTTSTIFSACRAGSATQLGLLLLFSAF
jgi:hypothetical protein